MTPQPIAEILPDGRVRLSASQIETYRLCPRKWAFTRLLGSRSGRSAELGTQIHTELEDWLRDGKAPQSRIALKALPHLPPPKSKGLEVECTAKVETEVAVYTGRIDARLLPRVYDHKTTSGFQYVKNDLSGDTQAAIYALSTFAENPDLGMVELQWTYLHTKLVDAVRVIRSTATRTRFLPVLQACDETALEMREHRGTPHDVPPNASACQAFGGCPYESECGLTAQERVRSIMSQLNFKERLAKKLADQNAAKAAEESAPAPSTDIGTAASNVNPPESKPAPAPDTKPTVAASVASKRLEKVKEAKAAETLPEGAVADAEKGVLHAPDAEPDRRMMGYRDHCAIAAVNGIIAARTISDLDAIASEAYAIADAMGRARNR